MREWYWLRKDTSSITVVLNTESKIPELSIKVPYRTLQKRQMKQNNYNVIGIAWHARTQMASRYSRYLAAHNFCVFQECMIAKILWFPVPCSKSTSGRQNGLASWDKFGNKLTCCHLSPMMSSDIFDPTTSVHL